MARRRRGTDRSSAVLDPGPASPAVPRRPRRAHSGGGGDPTTPSLGGGAWPLCSRRNHEPLPPQVPEPIGASSAIPLPAGDWVTVARYEEGRKGLDPSKSKRSAIGVLQSWGGKGPLTNETGSLKNKDLKGKTPDRSRAEDRKGGGYKNLFKEEKRGVSCSLTMVEAGAGLLIEGRGGGLKQVGVKGKAPHRYKKRKLMAEQGKDTALY